MSIEVLEAPSVADLLSREIPPTRSWVEPKIITHSGISIAVAGPKRGKSLVVSEICRSIISGDNTFGHPDFTVPRKGKVLALDYEVGEGGLHERLKAILSEESQENIRNFRYVCKDTEKFGLTSMLFSDPAGFDKLYRLVDATQPNLLVIDPVRRCLGAWDESKATDVGLFTNRLDKLVADFKHNNMSILLVHHTRKEPTGEYRNNWDELDPSNASGSGRWFGDFDCLITMAKTEEEKFNKNGHRYWTLRTRFRTRHSEDPADVFLNVNEHDDLRVRFAGKIVERPPTTLKRMVKEERPVLTLRGDQDKLMFDVPSERAW